MPEFDYTFTFKDLGAKETPVHIVNHRDNSCSVVYAQIDERNAFKAVRRPALDVEAVSDVFTLAVVAHVVDRMAVRQGDEVCRICVVAPVWNPELLGSQKVKERLEQALNYYTGDTFVFNWRQRGKDTQRPQSQLQLGLVEAVEVALWSGGLDSAGGLWNRRLQKSASRYMVVGTGANDTVLGTQRQTFREACRLMPGQVDLLQVPIHIIGNAHMPTSSTGRARGFVFTLVGAACAYAQNQSELYIYENGVGAINLPYCAAEVGLDHTRSVHPASLWQMQNLLPLLLHESISLHNPFLFLTKAQLCEPLMALAQSPSSAKYIWKTMSCDSPYRQAGLPQQCGYCTSCLLRRQALAVDGIDDLTRYAVHYIGFTPQIAHPLRMMLHQVHTMRASFCTSDPWPIFREHFPGVTDMFTPQLVAQTGSREAARESVLRLYRSYCEEWAMLPEDATHWFAPRKIVTCKIVA